MLKEDLLKAEAGTVVVIGAGQGGTQSAITLAAELGTIVSGVGILNLSAQDVNLNNLSKDFGNIKVIELRNVKSSIAGKGTGADPEKAKTAFMESLQSPDFKKDLLSLLTPQTKIVIIEFSTAGGFGSGTGPILMMAYANFKNILVTTEQKGLPEDIFVVANPILPDMRTGSQGLLNTITCLNKIKDLANKGIGATFLIDNETGDSTMNLKDRLSAINNSNAQAFKRYLTEFGSSSAGNLDLNDRFRAFSYAGIHAFVNVSLENGKIIKKSSHLVPQNTRVKHMSFEVSESFIEHAGKLESMNGLVVADPKPGFFEEGQCTTSIVHIAGASNISKLVEIYETRYDEIQNTDEDVGEKDNAVANGFKDIDEKKSWISGQKAKTNCLGTADLEEMFQ